MTLGFHICWVKRAQSGHLLYCYTVSKDAVCEDRPAVAKSDGLVNSSKRVYDVHWFDIDRRQSLVSVSVVFVPLSSGTLPPSVQDTGYGISRVVDRSSPYLVRALRVPRSGV